ncbi:anthrone oxygenase family protein [Streptomyces sp. NPDC003300]|uniref:anthrone oxygenase family protein n=1 Tax=unclassified Streptomyces TaxID=2593676 RepID=UPI0033ACFDA9
MKTWQLVNILLSAAVSGMFWGPWLALTRSMPRFEPDFMLPLVRRLSRNMAQVMTVLMPAALLSAVPVLVLSYDGHRRTFFLTLAALALFVVALVVTAAVEVPIVTPIGTWTVDTLPDDWQELRDRWGRFHLVRIGASVTGVALVLVAAVY